MTEHEKAWRAEYAKTLRALMRRKKISIKDLSKLLDISESSMKRYANGSRLPNVYISQRIKEILH